MSATTRMIYEIHHHYHDGSTRKTQVALSDDATAIYIQPESGGWFGLHGPAEARSIADAITALADEMVVSDD